MATHAVGSPIAPKALLAARLALERGRRRDRAQPFEVMTVPRSSQVGDALTERVDSTRGRNYTDASVPPLPTLAETIPDTRSPRPTGRRLGTLPRNGFAGAAQWFGRRRPRSSSGPARLLAARALERLARSGRAKRLDPHASHATSYYASGEVRIAVRHHRRPSIQAPRASRELVGPQPSGARAAAAGL